MLQIKDPRPLTNLAQLVRKYGKEGYGSAKSFLDLPRSSWEIEKSARFSAEVPLIDEAIRFSLSQRDARKPFGLLQAQFDKSSSAPNVLTEFFQYTPYVDLALAMNTTLKADFTTVLERIADTDPRCPIRRAYESFRSWMPIYREAGNPSQSPLGIFDNGIGTAARVMSGVLYASANYHLKRNPTASIQKLLQVAANSYQVVVDLYLAHNSKIKLWEDRFARATKELYDQAAFDMDYTAEKERLILSEESVRILSGTPKDFDVLFSRTRLGCPARVNLSGKSAIRTLWGWHLDIAPHIYKIDLDDRLLMINL